VPAASNEDSSSIADGSGNLKLSDEVSESSGLACTPPMAVVEVVTPLALCVPVPRELVPNEPEPVPCTELVPGSDLILRCFFFCLLLALEAAAEEAEEEAEAEVEVPALVALPAAKLLEDIACAEADLEIGSRFTVRGLRGSSSTLEPCGVPPVSGLLPMFGVPDGVSYSWPPAPRRLPVGKKNGAAQRRRTTVDQRQQLERTHLAVAFSHSIR